MIKHRYFIVLTLLLLLAVGLRLYDLRADPPAYFADDSQDFTTDGAYLTIHAKNAVQFGQSDLFGYKSWTAFKIAIVSGAAYVMFSLFGVSRVTANLVGILLSLGGLFFFLAALHRQISRRAVLLTAFFLATSFVAWIYGRMPFSENGLFFLAAVTFYVFSRWFDRLWGKVTIGVLIALAGMLGKSFGFLLILGPIVAILYGPRGRRWTDIAAVLVPAAIVTAVIQLLFYSDQGFLSFLWEHGAGEHGFPHGFTSVPAFFESLICVARQGLHRYTPVLSLLAGLLLVLLLISQTPSGRSSRQRSPLSAADRLLVFVVVWIVSWILLVSPFNYQPLRYAYVLIFPMSVMAALLLDRLNDLHIGPLHDLKWWRLALLILVFWYIVHYVAVHPFITKIKLPGYYGTAWYSAPIGVVVVFLIALLLRKRSFVISVRTALVITLGALALSLVADGRLFYSWYHSKSRAIDDAACDLPQILGPSAVVSGQYGPALAADAPIRSFPYFVIPDLEAVIETYKKYPVTHIVVSCATWDGVCGSIPVARQAPIIARYWLRDTPVCVVRVASLFRNPEAIAYPLTDFERATDYWYAHELDTARFYMDRFLAAHPHSKAGLMQRYELAFQSRRPDDARKMIDALLADFPSDFVVQFMGASYFRWLYQQTQDSKYYAIAQEHLKESIRLNPTNEVNLTMMFQQYSPTDPVIR